MMEFPPQALRFSKTTTDAPAFLASIAAASPATPLPTTTTSASISQLVSITSPFARPVDSY